MDRTATLDLPHTQQRTSLQTWAWVVVIVCSIAAVISLLMTTYLGGIGLSTDSVNFIAGSRGILEGRGFMRYFDYPTASWPPLYPMLISGLTLLIRGSGLDILEGLRFAQALVYGLTILATGGLFLRYIPSRLYALLGLVAVLLARPLLLVTVYVWTEGLFILLSLVFFYYLPGFLEEHKWWQFLILLAVTFLGTMQRFGGVGLIPAGCLCILLFMQNASFIKRFLYASLFGLSIIPTAIWIVFAWTLPGSWGRGQADPMGALAINLQNTVNVLSEWLMPLNARTPFTTIVLTLVVLALIVGIIVHYYRQGRLIGKAPSTYSHPVMFAVYILSFMAFLYVYMVTTYNTPLDQRHLSVFYIFVMLVIFWYIERLSRRLCGVRWREYAIVGVVAVWLIHPASVFRDEMFLRQGQCCQAMGYRQLPIVDWLETNPLPGRVYSNAPIPTLFTTQTVYGMPFADDDLLKYWYEHTLNTDLDLYYIEFNDSPNLIYQGSSSFYYTIPYRDELTEKVDLEVIATFEEATVYHMQRKPVTEQDAEG